MGILLDAEYRESICDKRDNCAYYVEGFYSRHVHHINDFEQLHNEPGKPCRFYYPRNPERQSVEEDPFTNEIKGH